MRTARLVIAATALGSSDLSAQARGDWASYGRDPGGARFSPLTQITRENVATLQVAWTFNTGEAGLRPRRGSEPSLEVTPLVVDGTMYISTPLGKVFALDPVTGRERWRFDAKV
ncbi:MAG: PQQ-binding-like beta-propeller repeat protein, partial [Gemmatimonadota bacterium]